VNFNYERKIFQKGKIGEEKTSKVSNSMSVCCGDGERKKEEKR
jgi:hypothetical protein